MPTENLISATKLFQHLEREISDGLMARGIYDIRNCGWLDEDTPDPQFLGHAMWQVEPPLQHEHHAVLGEASVRHRPTEEDEVLTVSGTDFEGLMCLARTSLGLLLWHQQVTEDALFDDNDQFWLHYLSAMVMLNAASDRLREFFVMALFRESSGVYHTRKGKWEGNKYAWYQTPFIHAKDSANESTGEVLSKLAPIAQEIYQYREARNVIVHDIATKIGQRERELTRRQRQRFDEQQTPAVGPEPTEAKDAAQRFADAQESHKAEVRQAADRIVTWYMTLVKASSYVFEVENHCRKRMTVED